MTAARTMHVRIAMRCTTGKATSTSRLPRCGARHPQHLPPDAAPGYGPLLLQFRLQSTPAAKMCRIEPDSSP
jgi:hypothetical protein